MHISECCMLCMHVSTRNVKNMVNSSNILRKQRDDSIVNFR